MSFFFEKLPFLRKFCKKSSLEEKSGNSERKSRIEKKTKL